MFAMSVLINDTAAESVNKSTYDNEFDEKIPSSVDEVAKVCGNSVANS